MQRQGKGRDWHRAGGSPVSYRHDFLVSNPVLLIKISFSPAHQSNKMSWVIFS